MLSFQKCPKCGSRKFCNSNCKRGSSVSSLILFWTSKDKTNQTKSNKTPPQFCFLDLLFPELWDLIFSFCGIDVAGSEALKLENWLTFRTVSKSWFNKLEKVNFKSICVTSINHSTILPRYDSYIRKLPQEIVPIIRSLEVVVMKSQSKQFVTNLRFSSAFVPLPEAKDLKFNISDEFETSIVSWEPDKIIFPSRKTIYSRLPSLQAIEIVHNIITEKKHILTFTTRIQPKNKIVTSFVMKKEESFLNFDSIHIRINFGQFGGMSISKVEHLILTGKTWSLYELQEFVILLPSLKSLMVDISDSKTEEDSIINWVTRKFGPQFINRKTEKSLYFFDLTQK